MQNTRREDRRISIKPDLQVQNGAYSLSDSLMMQVCDISITLSPGVKLLLLSWVVGISRKYYLKEI